MKKLVITSGIWLAVAVITLFWIWPAIVTHMWATKANMANDIHWQGTTNLINFDSLGNPYMGSATNSDREINMMRDESDWKGFYWMQTCAKPGWAVRTEGIYPIGMVSLKTHCYWFLVFMQNQWKVDVYQP